MDPCGISSVRSNRAASQTINLELYCTFDCNVSQLFKRKLSKITLGIWVKESLIDPALSLQCLHFLNPRQSVAMKPALGEGSAEGKKYRRQASFGAKFRDRIAIVMGNTVSL